MVVCSTMAQQQAQLLLHMSSLESVNFGVHQNNTEAFAVVLCHLAELHAEQVRWSCDPLAPPRNPQHRGRRASVAFQGLYSAVAELLQHLRQQFPPHSHNAKVSSAGPDQQNSPAHWWFHAFSCGCCVS